MQRCRGALLEMHYNSRSDHDTSPCCDTDNSSMVAVPGTAWFSRRCVDAQGYEGVRIDCDVLPVGATSLALQMTVQSPTTWKKAARVSGGA